MRLVKSSEAHQVFRKFDPDAMAVERYQPRSPMCMRCGREATFENPIGVTFRPDWNPLNKDKRNHVDALCAACREFLAR